MNPAWTCFQCEAPNPMAARHCSACGARRPPVVQPLAEADEAPAEVVPPAEPAASDMLSGLARLVAQAGSGQMAPAAFAERMRVAAGGLDEVFGGMAAELFALPEADEGYLTALESGLEDAASLFRIALAELEGFGESADPARLRIGMLVAEKAEEHYQGLVAGVRADAAGHGLRGQADRVRRLAAEVLDGTLTVEGYRVCLADLEEAIRGWLRDGAARAEAGLAAAREFDGTRVEPLNRAAAELEEATQALGQVILALHDPEATRQAARRILVEAESEG